jgi:hypothetical protein
MPIAQKAGSTYHRVCPFCNQVELLRHNKSCPVLSEIRVQKDLESKLKNPHRYTR